jgi:hypothetical protein
LLAPRKRRNLELLAATHLWQLGLPATFRVYKQRSAIGKWASIEARTCHPKLSQLLLIFFDISI